MSESDSFWIPSGIPAELQVALSIPGDPPKTVGEHRGRLEAYLVTLAEEVEEDAGRGIASEDAYAVIPDQTLYLEMPVGPHTLVQILLASDLMPSLSIPESSLGPGVDDPELQERCRESGFQDRLVGLRLE